MSIYSKSNFETQHYDDSRPQYSTEFYEELFNYHKGQFKTAIDLGCGTGFVTFQIANHFDKVIGTDPSQTMITQCENTNTNSNVSFSIGSGESIPFESNSIDLITAGECAHWFNHLQFFNESYRVLNSGGTLAYWLYKDPIFIGYPKANKIYEKYTYGTKFINGFESYMGPFYQQPGHNYLKSLMKEIEVPQELYKDIIRKEYIVGEANDSKLIIKKTIDMKWFLNYVKSWSAYHSWMETNGNKYDIADEFIKELKDSMNWDDDTKLDVEWDTVYVFATKK